MSIRIWAFGIKNCYVAGGFNLRCYTLVYTGRTNGFSAGISDTVDIENWLVGDNTVFAHPEVGVRITVLSGFTFFKC